MKLVCKFKNCFGIHEMKHIFDFQKKGKEKKGKENVFSVYAKNGVMKTSFTEVFSKIRQGEKNKILDKIFVDEKPEFNLCKDEDCKDKWNFDKDSLFVIKSMDSQYKSEYLSALLVNDNTKKRLETLLKLKEDFFLYLKNKSGLKYDKKEKSNDSDLEIFFFQDLGLENDSFLNQLKNIEDKLKNKLSLFNHIKYDEIFDKTLFKKINEEEFQNNVEEFISKNNEIYKNYGFLEKGKFSYAEFKIIAEELKKNNFFVQCNSIRLNDSIVIKDEKELKEWVDKIDKEIKEIPALSSINKLLNTGKGRNLKQIIENNIEIVPYLKRENTNLLKEQLWISYIKDNEENFNKLKESFKSIEEEIENHKNETTEWEKALEIFEKRFSPPYKMNIANKFASIIGEGLPAVLFEFKNHNNETQKKEYNQEELNELGILSQGERRALYLLNIIFDIEKLKIENKTNPKDLLIIIDDIADSFDYKNKYAIIEYLNEIAEIPGFKLIILTHNFDFYRAINLRLAISKSNMLYAIKQNNKIKLEKFQLNIDDKIFFLDWIKELNNRKFIALIPYVRNIIQFTNKIENNDDYKTLTKVLHISDTNLVSNKKVKYNEIFDIFSKYIKFPDDIIEKWENNSELLEIYNEANDVLDQYKNDKLELKLELELELKVVLSIAIRLKSEEYMIKKLKLNGVDDKEINQNKQTGQLFNLCLKNKLIPQNDQLILKKALIIMPENVHINSFMYEPLIDTELEDLIKSYNDIKNLT
ncbi:AAA family ATPase [Mesomycoplasma bovoculi]|uniref:Protein CR006 P-loop domain-containing protein n=1 Tax=Mesomycoplasma bovoculi M165/69 TaxID=743966 RepID=W5UTA8_9BACT|nr:AAA family ATPase [Mesomycoplasma bovoculi]AHH45050.1 hypothetical protein MYB_00190 [Mesomycoplasma bovoculi M165/69]